VDSTRLREAIVAAGARLGARQLVVAAEGDLSIRLDAGRLLITPSGRRKDALAVDDLVVVALDNAGVSGDAGTPRPSSDVAIHRAIYRARPDVAAVVHAHLPAAMALTAAGERPDPALLPETALLLPRLPFVPFAPMGSDELAAAVADALAEGMPETHAVVLERHGAVAVGSGTTSPAEALSAAMDRMELVDVLCRVTRDALLLRSARRTLGLD
jgi:ribulose-5-phosphate 4-epimerase/fuculose-1-phosphate aldolase